MGSNNNAASLEYSPPVSNTHKVLIIEDDMDIINLLEIHLLDMNCSLTKSYNGLDGLEKARAQQYDLIILDITLPKKTGIEVCRQLRLENNYTPIFMISAKSEKYDKVLGLEYGADAYMTKPFRIQKFINQIDEMLNGNNLNATKTPTTFDEAEVIQFNTLKLDPIKKEALIENQKINLSLKEFKILYLLASTPGKSYSRIEILKLVWGYEIKGYEHTVNTHINRLRSKIEHDIQNPNYILNSIGGVGYRFNEKLIK